MIDHLDSIHGGRDQLGIFQISFEKMEIRVFEQRSDMLNIATDEIIDHGNMIAPIRSAPARSEPMHPAPPVTNIFITIEYSANVADRAACCKLKACN